MDYFDQTHALDSFAEMNDKPHPWSDISLEGVSTESHHVPVMPSSYHFNEYPVATEYPSPSMKMKTNYNKPQAVEPYSRLYPESPSPSPDPSSTRIGRPPKATSNTKMAHYARNYRAVKKEQMRHLEIQNEELLTENVSLRKHNLALQEHLKQLQKEIQSLRVVLDQDTQIGSIVSRMGGRQIGCSSKDVGVCFHMVGGRVSVEVCEQCSSRVRARNQASQSPLQQPKEDPFLSPPSNEFSPFLL